MPLFLLYSSRKKRIFFFYWFVIGSAIGFILFLLLDNGCFDYKTIAHKYCYFYNYNPNDLRKYNDVDITDFKDNEYIVVRQYRRWLDTIHKDSNIHMCLTQDFFQVQKFFIVDVLKYTDDSLLARVRVSWNGSGDKAALISRIGYVPRFTLFDTLPRLVKDTMKVNNWSEESRKE